MQRPQKTPRDAYDTPKDTQRCLETFDSSKDTQRCLETFDSSKDTQQCSERLFQRHLGMPGEFGILQRYLEMPGATQGAKNTLRDVKLPRATWVSPGFSRSKPLFPDVLQLFRSRWHSSEINRGRGLIRGRKFLVGQKPKSQRNL
jgi:hypothetical protein